MKDSGHYRCFRLEISRGFRHQIRCHLAWLGFPLLGDLLYGGPPGDSPGLALLAEEISFPDPLTGEVRTCAVPLEESLVFAARG
jgi:23S rRNA pseudouridine1911/1915/1917 synthase